MQPVIYRFRNHDITFKIKRDTNGNIARLKVRWVVQRYLQQFGVDYD